MKLGDKAEESPDVELAADLQESEWQLVDDDPDLTPADELTDPGEFPKYGDFVKAVEWSPYEDDMKRGQSWIEIPAALAQWLVEHDIGSDNRWFVKEARKVEGRWQFTVEDRTH